MQPLASSLDDVGVLELLRNDDRPTFVLDTSELHSPASSLVFRNIALESFIRQDDGAIEFEEWAISFPQLAETNKNWGGKTWTSTTIQDRWTIVYCSQTQHRVPAPWISTPHESQAPVNRPRNTSVSIPPFASLAHKSSQVFSDCGVTFSQPCDAPSWPTLEIQDPDIKEPIIIDWLRYHIAGLPPYLQFVKDFDWASTPLGPMSGWPHHLRQVVISSFSNPEPRFILWSESCVLLYNEAAIPRIGSKHPAALGASAADTFPELWPDVVPLIRPCVFEGQVTKLTRELLFIERNDGLEETYWNMVLAPLLGENGYAEGVLDSFTEQTTTVIAQRRRDLLSELAYEINDILTLKELWTRFLAGLREYDIDVPYAMLYAVDTIGNGSDGTASFSENIGRYSLQGTVGVQQDLSFIPPSLDLAESASDSNVIADACRRAWDLRQTVMLQTADSTLPACLAISVPERGWGDIVNTVAVMPVSITKGGALSFLIIALNPRRPFIDESLRFAHSLRDTLAKPAWFISRQRYEEINDGLARQLKVSTLEAARTKVQFQKLAESAPIGICTFSGDGRTLYVNDEYLALIGVSRPYESNTLWDEGGNNWQDEVNPDDMPFIKDAWESLISRKTTSITIRYRLKRPWRSVDKATGTELVGETWLVNKATAEIDDEDNVSQVHAWLHDASHQYYTENLMTQRLKDALETKRQSENFIDLISHELRNPMSAILQSADGIITSVDKAQNQDALTHNGLLDGVSEAAQTIVLCAQHQHTLVDDILTLSKLDSNLLVISPERIWPPNLIEKVLRMYESELKMKDVATRLEIDPSFTDIFPYQDFVMLDPSRLLQVLINLLTNAMKFTQFMDERRITIYLSASYEVPVGKYPHLTFIEPRVSRGNNDTPRSAEWGDGQDLYLQIAVQDTGRGIGEEEIKLLFHRFSQASPKTYKQYGGSGLGLFISRELTELQGGQIGVSSEGLGKGSTFAFYVRARRCLPNDDEDVVSPVAVPERNCDTPVVASSNGAISEKLPLSNLSLDDRLSESHTTAKQEIHVLLVEDNLINQKVMSQQLRHNGCVVHIANHGLECLQFLQQTPFWHSPSAESQQQQQTRLSVILMDWEMPIMNGIDCVREIRKLEDSGQLTAHIPVIAVTANARSEQISVAMAAGMDDLVTKPFRLSFLVPRMENLVARWPAPLSQLGAPLDTE